MSRWNILKLLIKLQIYIEFVEKEIPSNVNQPLFVAFIICTSPVVNIIKIAVVLLESAE